MKKYLLALAALVAFSGNVEAASYTTKQYDEPHALGLKRHPLKLKELKRRAKKHQAVYGVDLIPGKVDLSPIASPPENQGGCGSCWAFGITKALRSEYMIAGIDPGTLAFNYLLNNCGPGPRQGGCNGGDFDAGESFLNGAGPWLENLDPYTQREGRCKALPPSGTAISYHVVGNGTSRPSFADLALAHSKKHVLVVDVAVCGQWGNYAGGIFDKNQCGANSINHIINTVGHNCETSVDAAGNCVFNSAGQPINGDGYLIAMNNWGTGWGEKGYMRTRWGIDAIADTAMYFEIKQPTPPPVPPVPPTPPTPVPPVPGSSIPVWVWIVISVLGGGLVVSLFRK